MFLEVGGCYRRYHTAMMRTVVLGELSESMLKAQERMKLALRELKSAMRPGLTVSDADSIVRNIISENEVNARLVTRSGYSIGIAFPPSWDEGYILSLNPGDFTILEEGMTFHVIPWMWGVDGDKTVGISDTIRITEDGCESFFTLDEDFVVKEAAPDGLHLAAVPESVSDDIAQDDLPDTDEPADAAAADD
jgi:Xaa-Pro dipeptidase